MPLRLLIAMSPRYPLLLRCYERLVPVGMGRTKHISSNNMIDQAPEPTYSYHPPTDMNQSILQLLQLTTHSLPTKNLLRLDRRGEKKWINSSWNLLPLGHPYHPPLPQLHLSLLQILEYQQYHF
nr:hypothetical protein Q903MT_gene1481 [Picea sitchensis]